LYRDLVALAATHEGGADGRLVADPALARRGLSRSDDLETILPVRASDDHRGADADAVTVRVRDHLGVLQLGLERGDAPLQERLLLLGVLVLGVLGDVAIHLRVVDARRDARTLDRDEVLK